MNETVTQVEDKIIEALQDMTYIKTLETYQGTIEDFILSPDIMIPRFPALMISLAGNRYIHESHPQVEARQVMQFEIIAAATSLRSEAERRRGTAGTYQILEDVRTRLSNNAMSLSIKPLALLNERPLFNNKIGGHMISVYTALYETEIDYVAT